MRKTRDLSNEIRYRHTPNLDHQKRYVQDANSVPIGRQDGKALNFLDDYLKFRKENDWDNLESGLDELLEEIRQTDNQVSENRQ